MIIWNNNKLVNAHRVTIVWNHVRLRLTLQVADLQPIAFILWYIYIYVDMFFAEKLRTGAWHAVRK